MIKFFNDFEAFQKEVQRHNIDVDLKSLLKLDVTFFEKYEKFILISIKDYAENPNNILILSKNYTLIYTTKNYNNYEKVYRIPLKKPYGESTVITLLTLRQILKNYTSIFEKIRSDMDILDRTLNPETIEETGRSLRKLTDRVEELVQLIIMLKERDIKEFNTVIIAFDYDMLNAESRYWLERCRSHVYRISSLRTKSEIRNTRELNQTISKLTVIMAFLSIVAIVVSVPGTIGAIFGIPALSNKYFEGNSQLLLWSLIVSTTLSIVLGYMYWKSLKFSAK